MIKNLRSNSVRGGRLNAGMDVPYRPLTSGARGVPFALLPIGAEGTVMGENPKGPTLEPTNIERFKEVVEAERGKIWSIVVAQIDPDGVGSAMLLKLALESLGAEVAIFYGGTVGHPQNRTMFNHFELEKDFRLIADLPPEGPIALVDSSRYDDPRFGMSIAHARFKIVIDHHHDPQIAGKNGKDRFMWVVSVGSASTLTAVLVKALGIKVDERTATCAAIGIHADTDKLVSEHTTPEDRTAFGEMMAVGSQEDFSVCCNYAWPQRYRALLVQTLNNCIEVDEYVIGHPTELLRGDEGDLLSIIANHLKRHEGAHTVIVWGISGGEIRASVRTSSRELNLSSLIADVFGKGAGGAKRGSGGARIQIGNPFNPTENTAPEMIAYIGKTLIARLESRVGVRQKPKVDNKD